MKKKTAVLFSSSPAYAFALFVGVSTFFKNSPRLAAQADVYIFHYHWDEKTKNIFSRSFPVRLVAYDLPAFIPRTEFVNKFTPALFARFEIFKLLQEYEKVLCLDADILVQKELEQVFDFSHDLAMTMDDCPTVGHNFTALVPGYDLSLPCFNGGFIALKRAQFPANPSQVYEWLYQMLAQHADIIYLGDQGITNLMLQHFRLTPDILPSLYNLPASAPCKQLKKAYIVHSTGHRKFWCYYYFPQWYRQYECWIAAGGAPVSVRKDTVAWKKLIRKFHLDEKIFFQLAPDGFKYPIKFVLFIFKYLWEKRPRLKFQELRSADKINKGKI